MNIHSVILIHQEGFLAMRHWWPVLIFILLAEIFILKKSKRFTGRGAIDAVISTSIPFLFLIWGLSQAPLARGNSSVMTAVPGLLVAAFAAGMIFLRTLVLHLFYEASPLWELMGSIPLPLFVYFTAWVTLQY